MSGACRLPGLIAAFPILISLMAAARDTGVTILRWSEGSPGCTFSADDDGKYRYGIWTDDLGVIIAVDADEVRKARLRAEPLFALFVTVRYRGPDEVSINPANFTLEFIDHYHTVQTAIDPDEFADKLLHETAKGHESSSLTETVQFLRSSGLRPVRLDSHTAQATGWIFFSAKSKWIGDWKAQEQFVLRIPVADRRFEFPFALPPSRGDLLLRRR